jgi:diaminopimelate decarboxylase
MQTKSADHLWVGGCDTTQLAVQYGTPLFVYDENEIRQRIRAFHEALQDTGLQYGIAYAAKAFCTVAMCQIAAQENIAVDVVSGGELYTALQAGVSPENIHMHGNNKTREELEFAVRTGISTIIVDNFVELSMLDAVAAEAHRVVDVLLRIAPGVEAHTHEYISTGQQDSKFGFDLESGQAHQALHAVQACAALRCVGLHSHIGSQIFDGSGFGVAAERMGRIYADGLAAGLPLRILNLGGGFGIRYTEEDDPVPVANSIHAMADAVVGAFLELNLAIPEIWIEPGRSIVGPAGVTLYRVGTQKVIPDIRNYVSVDGGMTDNPRLALYGAKYEAVLANRLQEEPDGTWAIAGKCCESGDMVIWDAPLPQPKEGDLLAVFATGAYNYSMASHYNRNPNPAVVFVRDGQSTVVVERETWKDVVRMDRSLDYPSGN